MSASFRTASILAGILVLGACLRLYGLGRESFWNDELSTWARSVGSAREVIFDSDVHPPGYRFLAYLVVHHVGDSEVVLRFPSAVAGVLSVAMMFILGRHLYGVSEGLVAAGLTAVLRCPIAYSQEARAYALVILFALASTYSGLLVAEAWWKSRPMPKLAALGYIGSAIVLSLLHYFGTYLVLLQAVTAWSAGIASRRRLAPLLALYVPIAVVFAPWVPYALRHFSRPIWIEWVEPRRFAWSYLQFLFNGSKGLALIVLLLWLYLMVVEVRAWRRGGLDRRARVVDLLLLGWLIVPFLGAVVKSAYSAPVITARNLLISLPPAYLLLARAMVRLPLGRGWQEAVCVGGIELLCVHLIFGIQFYSRPFKEQWREAVAYVVANDHLQDDTLVIGHAWSRSYFDYYFARLGSTARVEISAGTDADIAKIGDLLGERRSPYVWFLWGHRHPDRTFVDFLKQHLQLRQERRFIETGAMLFENTAAVEADQNDSPPRR